MCKVCKTTKTDSPTTFCQCFGAVVTSSAVAADNLEAPERFVTYAAWTLRTNQIGGEDAELAAHYELGAACNAKTASLLEVRRDTTKVYAGLELMCLKAVFENGDSFQTLYDGVEKQREICLDAFISLVLCASTPGRHGERSYLAPMHSIGRWASKCITTVFLDTCVAAILDKAIAMNPDNKEVADIVQKCTKDFYPADVRAHRAKMSEVKKVLKLENVDAVKEAQAVAGIWASLPLAGPDNYGRLVRTLRARNTHLPSQFNHEYSFTLYARRFFCVRSSPSLDGPIRLERFASSGGEETYVLAEDMRSGARLHRSPTCFPDALQELCRIGGLTPQAPLLGKTVAYWSRMDLSQKTLFTLEFGDYCNKTFFGPKWLAKFESDMATVCETSSASNTKFKRWWDARYKASRGILKTMWQPALKKKKDRSIEIKSTPEGKQHSRQAQASSVLRTMSSSVSAA